MMRKLQLKAGMLTAAIALSCGALPLLAEEESEHLMTVVAGTQISGYVSTTASWLAGRPLVADRPTLWSLHEALHQPVRSPQLAFDPLSSTPFQKVLEPAGLARPAGGITITAYPFAADREGLGPSPEAPHSASFGLSAVPEPGTLALLGLGAAGVCWRSRRGKGVAPAGKD